jgi:hypothetical protein
MRSKLTYGSRHNEVHRSVWLSSCMQLLKGGDIQVFNWDLCGTESKMDHVEGPLADRQPS